MLATALRSVISLGQSSDNTPDPELVSEAAHARAEDKLPKTADKWQFHDWFTYTKQELEPLAPQALSIFRYGRGRTLRRQAWSNALARSVRWLPAWFAGTYSG